MVHVITHIIIVLFLHYLVAHKFWKRLLLTDCSLFYKNNILYEYQFGLAPGRNATHAILSLVEYKINSFENHEISRLIFLDISKAFETMDHSILIGRLSKYGIRGIVLKWLQSYLSER